MSITTSENNGCNTLTLFQTGAHLQSYPTLTPSTLYPKIVGVAFKWINAAEYCRVESITRTGLLEIGNLPETIRRLFVREHEACWFVPSNI